MGKEVLSFSSYVCVVLGAQFDFSSYVCGPHAVYEEYLLVLKAAQLLESL